MPDEHLLYSVENNVARITINREQQRNAITPEAIHPFPGISGQGGKG